MKTLLASSPSPEGILALIHKYFYNPSLTLSPSGDVIMRGKMLKGYHVEPPTPTKRGNRWKFYIISPSGD